MSVKMLSNNSLGVLYTDRRIFHVDPFVVRELWNDVAPFITFAANTRIIQVPDPNFKMFEHRSGWIKQMFVYNDATPSAWPTNGSPAETISGITVDGIVGLPVIDPSWKNLKCEVFASNLTTYKGQVLVVGVAADNTSITIKSLGNPRSTTNQHSALADNDVFIVVGNAFGEETTAPEGYTDELEVVYNSTQIFKTSVQISGTLAAAALRGYSNELERLRLDKSKLHKIQKNRDFLYGTRPSGTGMKSLAGTSYSDSHSTEQTDADGKTVRLTMGAVPLIYRYGVTTGDNQNIFTIDAATYKYSNFVDDTEKIFQYLPEDGTKIALCGSGALSY
jgi:hypothetical protein